MIKTDCHVHTSFSSDSDSSMESMIQGAIAKGLDTITFTDHMDYDFPEGYGMDFIFDPAAYFEELNRLKAKYSDRISILSGIEIGLKPVYTNNYDDLLNSYDFDFVIGSTHLVDDIDPYYSQYWDNSNNDNDEKTCIARYFEAVYNNIKHYNNFNSLGHLDYIIRYSPYKPSSYNYKDYLELTDEILKFIIRKDIALEVNTSGFKSNNAPNPSSDIIKRYIMLGGRLITIGSDAHSPEYITFKFNELRNILTSVGVNEYAVYRDRNPYMLPL